MHKIQVINLISIWITRPKYVLPISRSDVHWEKIIELFNISVGAFKSDRSKNTDKLVLRLNCMLNTHTKIVFISSKVKNEFPNIRRKWPLNLTFSFLFTIENEFTKSKITSNSPKNTCIFTEFLWFGVCNSATTQILTYPVEVRIVQLHEIQRLKFIS